MSDDLDNFRDRVLWLVRQIPEGKVATYGQVAHLAGAPRAARAVGNVLRGTIGEDIAPLPWQRVINARGAISFKGDLARAELQRRLLRAEGVVFDDWRCDLDVHEWEPDQDYWHTDWSDEDEPA